VARPALGPLGAIPTRGRPYRGVGRPRSRYRPSRCTS
jgi:hypothetical protein